jgi:hypothetical protein
MNAIVIVNTAQPDLTYTNTNPAMTSYLKLMDVSSPVDCPITYALVKSDNSVVATNLIESFNPLDMKTVIYSVL